MSNKPTISIVGAGNLGSALAVRLREAGYTVDEIVWRGRKSRRRDVQRTAVMTGAKLVTLRDAQLACDVLWIAVPDAAIASCAEEMARRGVRCRIAFHSSGALGSDELTALKRAGAAVAAVHPLMSFVAGNLPSLRDVLFSLEGDRAALRAAKSIVRDLGGIAFGVAKTNKPLYHAFGAFTSPLLMAHFAAAEVLAAKAGVPSGAVRKAMRPIVMQTLDNYFRNGAAKSFSGPLVRGDVGTIQRHVAALSGSPQEAELYRALVREALARLPVRERSKIKKLIG